MAQNTTNDAIADGYLVKLNGKVWGIALGMIAALGLFVATNILVLKGGDDVGATLGRLGWFMWGYDVTFLGSIIGALWAFGYGMAIGWLACGIYNFAARR